MEKTLFAVLTIGTITPTFAQDSIFEAPLDLGTLWADNSGYSYAYGVSADGRVVVGLADYDAGMYRAFRHNKGDSQMTDLGTLKTDNAGNSLARAVSADGRVVVGEADNDDGESHAFRHNEGDSQMTDLGTFRVNNTGYSYANGVSADGRVVVGQADNNAAERRAFRHNEGDSQITDLGTLRANNTGGSYSAAISSDGRVVVGTAETDTLNESHAFRHNEGDSKMTDLGTLKTDNAGSSYARAVSADGRVVVGSADSDDGDSRVFRHNKGDSQMTDLGTLRADNTGDSFSTAVSADGRVVIGQANNDAGDIHAFRHNEGDSQMTDLGTLRADNAGMSYSSALSADGLVVVGSADNDAGENHAFWHNEGDDQITDLGTLRVDNTGYSFANKVSEDGRVVVGSAENDAGVTHAVVWKIKPLPVPPTPPTPPTPPVPPAPPVPPIITIVDRDNTHQAMANTAGNAQKVLSLYQGALSTLADARCQIGQGNYCVGAFTQLNTAQSSNNRMATGLFGLVRLPDEQWTIGASFNLAHNTELVDGYETRGDHQPGLGLFTRYQTNGDNSGLSLDASGAFLQQDMTIQRGVLANTEAGKGEATIKGYQARLAATYGIALSDRTQIAPLVAIKYQHVYRTGYTENRDAEFPATYGRMGSENTSLQLGMDASHHFTPQLSVNGGVGADVNLDRKREAFTGQIDYIGAYHYDRGETQNVRPYAYVGMNVDLTANSTVRVSSGWQQTDYSKDTVMVGLSYSYRW
ncbi:autotransporter domain-containing protein [Budvicia aquatica]|uniref:autotransporter domain-containing protein n=1 Tax=Budvicia aquatica TaxID=82979 RepID=UPI00208CCD87|nr:autotransporter domain-containing protein [Budvicia aquatica]GKX51792.1 hypothetical protein SOASR029_21010 [Budvicia aquatica]